MTPAALILALAPIGLPDEPPAAPRDEPPVAPVVRPRDPWTPAERALLESIRADLARAKAELPALKARPRVAPAVPDARRGAGVAGGRADLGGRADAGRVPVAAAVPRVVASPVAPPVIYYVPRPAYAPAYGYQVYDKGCPGGWCPR